MPLDGMLLSHYRLLRSLGNGQVGEVYLAEDVRDSQQVAIKVIRTTNTSVLAETLTATNEQEVERLEEDVSTPANNKPDQETEAKVPEQEAETVSIAELVHQVEALTILEAAARLEHPRIVAIEKCGVEVLGGQRYIYIVMPYLAEGAVTCWVEQQKRDGVLTVDEVATLLFQMGEALQYAHEQGVLHLGVSLRNVLIEGMTAEGSPLVQMADFGQGRLISRLQSEQEAEGAGEANDQYALAALAYELLTGHALSTKDGDGETKGVVAPSELNVELASALDRVLLRALAERAEERFPSVAEFCLAFDEAAYELDDLRTTLAITTEVAREGGRRTLMLPGKREVQVEIPAETRDLQVIRLKGMGDLLYEDGPVGDVIVTLTVVEPHSSRAVVTERPKNPLSLPGLSDREYPLFPPLNPPYLQIPQIPQTPLSKSSPGVLIADPADEETIGVMLLHEQGDLTGSPLQSEAIQERLEEHGEGYAVGHEASDQTIGDDDGKRWELDEQAGASQGELEDLKQDEPVETSRYEEEADTLEVQESAGQTSSPTWEITQAAAAVWEIETTEMKVSSQPLQEPMPPVRVNSKPLQEPTPPVRVNSKPLHKSTLLPIRVNSQPLQQPTPLPIQINSQPLQQSTPLPLRVNSQPLGIQKLSQPLQTPETPAPLPIPPTTQAQGEVPSVPTPAFPVQYMTPMRMAVPVKRKGEGTTVMMLLLILISLASGIFAWVTFQDYMRKQNAEAAVLAARSATATARVVAIEATATVGIKATAEAAIANPYPKYIQGSGELTMFDTLKDNKVGYTWDEQGGCVFKDGAYRASQGRSGEFTSCFAEFQRFGNFTFEVQMKVVKGACGGIAFRYNEIRGEQYLFQVCENGNYSLIHYLDKKGNATGLAGGNHSAVKKGLNQVNTLAVVANGGKYQMYVNGQKVAEASDTVGEGGLIGVAAVNYSGGVEVIYNNAKLWISQ